MLIFSYVYDVEFGIFDIMVESFDLYVVVNVWVSFFLIVVFVC